MDTNAREIKSEMDQHAFKRQTKRRLNWKKTSAEELETFSTVVVNYNFAPSGSAQLLPRKSFEKLNNILHNGSRQSLRSVQENESDKKWCDIPSFTQLFDIPEESSEHTSNTDLLEAEEQAKEETADTSATGIENTIDIDDNPSFRGDMKAFRSLSNFLPNQTEFANSLTQATQTKMKSAALYKQRQHELNRYRIAVEQKRLELLELKVAREKEALERDRMQIHNRFDSTDDNEMLDC